MTEWTGEKRKCHREYMQKWRLLNQEKIRIIRHRWRKNHPDYHRKYRLQHLEKERERMRTWRRNRILTHGGNWMQFLSKNAKEHTQRWKKLHPEKVRMARKRWIEAHPGKTREYRRNNTEKARTREIRWRNANPEKVRKMKYKHLGKGFEPIVPNVFNQPIDWHHIHPSYPFVVPMPREIHRAIGGKKHYVFNASIVCQLFGLFKEVKEVGISENT